jgi:hypothetical protein
MNNRSSLREWRSEEIAKLYLLKSDYKLIVEQYPTPLFDFFVKSKKVEEIRFAVEVKRKDRFESNLKQQLHSIKIYRNEGMLTIPVLLFRIDETLETGEIDFLVFPSFRENKLLVRETFKFKKLEKQSLDDLVSIIEKWFKRHVS